METALQPMVLFLAIAAYVFPALVAACRQHRQTMAICVLNVLLGWTVLGWIMCLTWACTYPGIVASREESA